MSLLPKRIVVIAGYAPSLVNFRGPLLQALRAQGHQVIALAPGEDAAVEAQLAIWGVHYHAVQLTRTGMNPRQDVKDISALTDVLRQLRPHLVLGYTIKPVVYGLLAARLAGVPHRYALITGLGYSFQGKGWKRRALSTFTGTLYRTALNGASRAIFQNPDDRDLFVERKLVPAKKCVVVNGSGVDLCHYHPLPLPKVPVFLMIARLLREKGVVEYVRAAQNLKGRFPETRFLLAGPLDPNPSGISKQELQGWISQGGSEYLGELKDVRPALAQSSVYVLPSYREGTPRTVLEAMAAGRAVITTDAPGCRETVKDGYNGFLIPVADVPALEAAMLRLLDGDLRSQMAQASLQTVREKYDVELVNAQMLTAMGLTPTPEFIADGSSQGPPAKGLTKNRQRFSRTPDLSYRARDLLLAMAGLLFLALPLAGLALLVRLKLGSPVLFSQQRPGLHGKPFTMHKLRTMRDAVDSHGQLLPDSERMTPLGRFLRASSLDELPGLLNVLRGDMSLVGPRPLLVEYLDRYTPQQARRHEVRPGITGWAQVNGRNAISWEEKFKLDVWYVDNRSFALDMKILWMTVQKVFKREGISAAGEVTMSKFEGRASSEA